VLAERYYALVEQIIRKYDRRGLILGDRYPSFYYPQVVRAAARHVDVISTNLNAAWDDGSFPKFQLETLDALSSKPILVSEIYMSAAENRSGNRNSTGNFPVVATQAQRAKSARNTIERLVRLPFVVGVDWFQWADEPTHGRFDAENYNFGLVDIADRPYEELTGMLAELDVQRIKREAEPLTLPFPLSAGAREKEHTQIVPPGPEHPIENFVQFEAMKNWDRERGFVAAQTPMPLADLYVCWRPGAIYLGLHGWDGVEKDYYRGGAVPKEDRALWIVRIGGKPVARARIGGGREGMVNSRIVRVESIPVAPASAWMTAAMEVPAEAVEKNSFDVGDEIEIDCELVTHARAGTVRWKGKLKLLE